MKSGVANFYFAFSKVENGAQIENVSFDGGSMVIELGSAFTAQNIMVGDDWLLTNWMFGGFASDAEYTGMTVVNVTPPAAPAED